MERNESGVDRLIRLVVGVVLLALVFVGPKTPWGWIGVIPLATALVGHCPLYRAFGIGTHHRHHPQQHGSVT